jgi:hypothetical protein
MRYISGSRTGGLPHSSLLLLFSSLVSLTSLHMGYGSLFILMMEK